MLLALLLAAEAVGIYPPNAEVHAAVGASVAMLAAAGGVALYSSLEEARLDTRAQRGALTEATSYGGVRAAQVVSLALASTGLASIAAGGVVLALTPRGAALQTRW